MGEPQLSVEPNPEVPFEVVREEPGFVVVSKPAGVVTQPGEGHTRDTLLNGLFARWGKRLQNLGKVRDYGLVHRLDRPTSGLVVVGLEQVDYDALRAQFAGRSIRKTYLALVHGAPNPPTGTERTPIREVRTGGRKLAQVGPHPHAQEAVTRYETLVRARGLTLVACRPETGRLHQVRAHLAHRGCPVVGDREYGPRNAVDAQFARAVRNALFLHAAELELTHPGTGARLTLKAPLPAPLLAFLDAHALSCPRRWKA